jgi:hypothetical protein
MMAEKSDPSISSRLFQRLHIKIKIKIEVKTIYRFHTLVFDRGDSSLDFHTPLSNTNVWNSQGCCLLYHILMYETVKAAVSAIKY